MKVIAKARYITADNTKFVVEIHHEKYKKCNQYKLYRSGEICAEGNCPKTYTTRDIFNYWIRDEGKIETFKELEECLA